jgi:hypothetical protein
MMKIGFLILAHKNPFQLTMLIDALLSYEGATIFLHIDRKSESLFQQIRQKYQNSERVELISERYKVYWGSYNQIRATLALIKAAGKATGPEYFCLLSGQDMPVQPVKNLASFLTKNKGIEYLVNFKLPDPQWYQGGLDRLRNYHINIANHGYLSHRINTVIARLQNYTGIKRRLRYELYGGSNWFNLSAEAIKYIVKYIEQHPEYLRQFRHSSCADEIFVQSIILNSDFRSRVVADDLRFIDWSSGPEYPRLLRNSDFDKLVQVKDKFFARKFDEEKDRVIIERLHKHAKG